MSNDPKWGGENRDKKARAILQTITHFTGILPAKTKWLDLGCGSGGIAAGVAPYVEYVLGVDPEAWSRWSNYQELYDNLQFQNKSIESLALDDNSFDVIICNQVYEHISDPQYLIGEIFRILRPGGYCYFAGPNLLFPIEPHVFWPFVHWLPRNFALRVLRVCRSSSVLDAYSTNYWTLKKWLESFQVNDAVRYILKNPANYCRSGLFWQSLSYIPGRLLDMMAWLSPGFVFILRKPID